MKLIDFRVLFQLFSGAKAFVNYYMDACESFSASRLNHDLWPPTEFDVITSLGEREREKTNNNNNNRNLFRLRLQILPK